LSPFVLENASSGGSSGSVAAQDYIRRGNIDINKRRKLNWLTTESVDWGLSTSNLPPHLN